MDRAHRGAIAEMGDDHVLSRDLWRYRAQLSGDELVGEAMKAIATHALVVIGARQRVGVVDERMAAVESGVEARDLRRGRESLHRRFDAGDIMRLVERRERDERLQFP